MKIKKELKKIFNQYTRIFKYIKKRLKQPRKGFLKENDKAVQKEILDLKRDLQRLRIKRERIEEEKKELVDQQIEILKLAIKEIRES